MGGKVKAFLIVISIVGLWNLINLIARFIYKEPSGRYIYHIVIGVFAAWFLLNDYA